MPMFNFIVSVVLMFQLAYNAHSRSLSPADYDHLNLPGMDSAEVPSRPLPCTVCEVKEAVDMPSRAAHLNQCPFQNAILTGRQAIDEHNHDVMRRETDANDTVPLNRDRRCCCCDCCCCDCCCCGSGSGSGEAGATIGDMIALASLLQRHKRMTEQTPEDVQATEVAQGQAAQDQAVEEVPHNLAANTAESDATSLRERRCCCCCPCCCCCGSGSGSEEAQASISDMIGLASLISRRTAKRMAQYPGQAKILKRRSVMTKRNVVGAWARAGSVVHRKKENGKPVATSWSESGRLLRNGTMTVDHREVSV